MMGGGGGGGIPGMMMGGAGFPGMMGGGGFPGNGKMNIMLYKFIYSIVSCKSISFL